jgi:hypothetical protein
MQADFKNMVKEIFGYERIRDIPEEELMHLTRTYGYSPLLQFLYSRYLKENNDRHYPASVARTAIYFSNPHWLHHQLQKNHLDWIEDPEVEPATEVVSRAQREDEPVESFATEPLPEQEITATEEIKVYETSEEDDPLELENQVVDEHLIRAEEIAAPSNNVDSVIIPEDIPEETAVKSEDIYAHTLLDNSSTAEEIETGVEDVTQQEEIHGIEENATVHETFGTEVKEPIEAVVDQPGDQDSDAAFIYPEFDGVEEITPLLDADTGFDQDFEESAVVAEELLPPTVETPVEIEVKSEQQPGIQGDEQESDADDTDGDETEKNQPAPGFRPISLPVTNDNETKLSFEPLYVVDYFASQGVKLSNEEESRDLLTNKLKSFTEWLKSMKRIHPEKLSHELDEKTELTIKTVAEHSNEKGEILTETMAEIFMKQGLVEKSMEVYEKLSLLYPSKSDYFAAKISALKAIGT